MDAKVSAGDRLGEYIVEERIGSGGFGDVWRAHHHVLTDRQVAIKVPHDEGTRERLRREGVIQDRLTDPRVIRTLGLDPDHEPPYLVVELVEGESLRERLQRESRLAPAEALRIAEEVLRALCAAHAVGVIHRDIKPENILLQRETNAVKIADFGLGRFTETTGESLAASLSHLTKEGALLGTLAYMAPEQKEAGRKVDGRADLYAFGVCLFEMLTGGLPVGGDLPSEQVADLDPLCDEIFRRCFTRLEKRYPTAGDALSELLLIQGESPGEDQPSQADLTAAATARPLPQARPLAQVKVGLAARAAAAAMDVLLFLGVFGFLHSLGGPFLDSPPGYVVASRISWLLGSELSLSQGLIAAELATFGLGWFWLLTWALEASPAKRLMGMRVRRLDGGRLGAVPALLRTLAYLISAMLVALAIQVSSLDHALGSHAAGLVLAMIVGVGLLSIALHPQGRGFHDIVGGCQVTWNDDASRVKLAPSRDSS